MRITIRGIQEAQKANARYIANLNPGGALGRAVQYATIETHRYATSLTHVKTGALRASHRMQTYGLRGRIYLDPTAQNPKTRERTAMYGPIENARGGSHAFYERTRDEGGPKIQRAALAGFLRDIAQ